MLSATRRAFERVVSSTFFVDGTAGFFGGVGDTSCCVLAVQAFSESGCETTGADNDGCTSGAEAA